MRMRMPEIEAKGVKIPIMGIGTYMMTGEECTEAVRNALGMGYTHIDTAHVYGNHEDIAIAIKGYDRNKLFITTKVWKTDLSKSGVIDSGRRALEELEIAHIDLFLIHWPNREFPMAETFKGMKELQDSGIIRAAGVSNFTIRHIEEALNAGAQIATNQVEFHPLFHQKELLDYCKSKGITLTAYSPVGKGEALEHPTIKDIAGQTGHTPAQICLAWIMSKGIIVIPKSSSKERQQENLEAVNIKLSRSHIEKIDAIGENKRITMPEYAEF
jgi:2,5-diketo-D-gluconate reductase B